MAYGKKTDNKFIAIFIVVGLILLALGKNILNALASGLMFAGAKGDGKKIADELDNTDPTKGTRTTFIKGVVDTVFEKLDRIWQDESGAIDTLNTLMNAAEGSEASAMFMRMKGKSLKAYIKSAGCDWDDLHIYLQSSIV